MGLIQVCKKGGCVVLLFAMVGCLGETWEQYAIPQHGLTRADRICHPYGQCIQGVWVKDNPTEMDPEQAHQICAEEYRQLYPSWSEDTVTTGLEIGRCMKAKGYTLKLEEMPYSVF